MSDTITVGLDLAKNVFQGCCHVNPRSVARVWV